MFKNIYFKFEIEGNRCDFEVLQEIIYDYFSKIKKKIYFE